MTLTQQTARSLAQFGVFKASGGRMGGVIAMMVTSPFFLIVEESEEPSACEQHLLTAFVPSYIPYKYAPKEIVGRFYGIGIATVILRKQRGVWKFRRSIWDGGLWSEPFGSLEDLLEDLNSRFDR